jgi:hypothetical protein
MSSLQGYNAVWLRAEGETDVSSVIEQYSPQSVHPVVLQQNADRPPCATVEEQPLFPNSKSVDTAVTTFNAGQIESNGSSDRLEANPSAALNYRPIPSPDEDPLSAASSAFTAVSRPDSSSPVGENDTVSADARETQDSRQTKSFNQSITWPCTKVFTLVQGHHPLSAIYSGPSDLHEHERLIESDPSNPMLERGKL